MIKCAKKLQQSIRMKLAKSLLKRMKKGGAFISRKMKQFLIKCRLTRFDRMKKVFFWIHDNVFEVLTHKWEVNGSLILQKFVRAFLSKIKNFIIVQKGRLKRYNYY